jgi:hypothetical protein
MKSIERRFINLKERNPYWSASMCFAESIYWQNFNIGCICKWFNKLVDKEDYAIEDKKEIIKFLQEITEPPKDNPAKKEIIRFRIVYSDRCCDPKMD